MKNENKNKSLLNDFKIIAIAFIVMYIFFQIHYYKESPLVLLKTVLAHFYLFIIPGYSVCLVFNDKMNQIERLIIGAGIGYGLQTFLLYLINFIIRRNIMNYNLYVSGALILLGIALFYKKK